MGCGSASFLNVSRCECDFEDKDLESREVALLGAALDLDGGAEC